MSASQRIFKQVVIALIFFVILGIPLSRLYFYFQEQTPSPSCHDNIKNQEEEGVDCGGPCKPCQEQFQEEIKIFPAQIFLVKDNIYSVIVQIRNNNSDYGAESLSYTFEFYDFIGNIISSRRGSTYIFPQETKYLIEDTIILSSEPKGVKFNVEDITWKKLRGFQEPKFEIYSARYQQLPPGGNDFSEYSAILKNKSDFEFSAIEICLILRDVQNQILGINKVQVENLSGQEERFFRATWPNSLQGEVKGVDFQVKTNLFLQEDFIKQYSL